jgi:hypothetical protein
VLPSRLNLLSSSLAAAASSPLLTRLVFCMTHRCCCAAGCASHQLALHAAAAGLCLTAAAVRTPGSACVRALCSNELRFARSG